MNGSKKLRVILFALPGFGNPVLTSLINDTSVDILAVFTVHYRTPFPYYEETQLNVICEEFDIPCYDDVKVISAKGLTLIRSYSPDLILVATFKQILTQPLLDIPRFGVVNFHPSLLPKFRGPCPSNAALLSGEKTTGVTAHYVTEGIDEGNILMQKLVTINEDEIDSQLRKKLAALSGDMIPDVIKLFSTEKKPFGKVQKHSQASFAPKPTKEEGYLETACDIDSVLRKMRAFNPIPGTSMLVNGERIAVCRYERLSGHQMDGIYEHENFIDLIIHTKGIRLYKKVSF